MAAPEKAVAIDFGKTLVGDDAVGMLAKLLWEIREICQFNDRGNQEPVVRTYMSYNAAATAWHMHEWFLKILPEDRREELFKIVGAEGEKDYPIAVQRANGSLAICRQLAVAGKHVSVVRNREDITAEVHSKEHEGKTLVTVVIQWEGKSYYDYEVYVAALKWWAELYVKLGYKHASYLSDAVAAMGEEEG